MERDNGECANWRVHEYDATRLPCAMRTLAILCFSALLCVAGSIPPARQTQFFQQPAAAGPLTATDTFNRADANPISNPMSDGIYSWTSGPGSMNDVQIQSNQAGGTTGNSYGAKVSDASATFAGDQISTLTIGSGTVAQMGVLVRIASDTDADGYLCYLSSSTQLQIYRIDDTGTVGLTQLGANIAISAVAAGDTIGLGMVGDTLTAYRNGVSVATRTDSTYTAGNPGIYFGLASRFINEWTASEL